MSSMREIKTRIKSIQETQQITRAMKLISVAKLKNAKNQLQETLPFFNRVKFVMADIMLKSGGNIKSKFFDINDDVEGKKKGFFVITGDRSLAGGYNNNIIKLTEEKVKEYPNAKLFVAGHVGRNHFVNKNANMMLDFDYYVNQPTIYRAREIAEYIINSYVKDETDEIHIIYTKMISAMNFEPQIMQLLPLELEKVKEDLKISNCFEETKELENERQKICDWFNAEDNLIYEPSEEAVFDVLVPKYVKGIIYGVLVEAFTSEHTARMLAMDSAANNADEILNRLKRQYNKERQAAITQEISEIVAGAETLKK